MPSTSSQTVRPSWRPPPYSPSLLHPPPLTAAPQLKLKSTLRLLIPRLRMAQKKDTAVSISSRREMSVLLSQSREASARIRVENIIQTDICVELMEILELYAELLLARAGLLDAREKESKNSSGGTDAVPDTGLEEAAAAIIYAAPRLPREVRELGIARSLLVERFGKDFAMRCNVDGGGGVVPKRVVDKLRIEPPRQDLVEAYLTEIARTYGVEWPKNSVTEAADEEMGLLETEIADEPRQLLNSGGGAADITTALSTPKSKPRLKPTSLPSFNSTSPPALPPLTPRSPISVAPPAPRSDNPSPKVRIPGTDEAGGAKENPKPATAAATKPVVGKQSTGAVVGGKIPDVDELAKRFRELRR